jgi:hypothetical protein
VATPASTAARSELLDQRLEHAYGRHLSFPAPVNAHFSFAVAIDPRDAAPRKIAIETSRLVEPDQNGSLPCSREADIFPTEFDLPQRLWFDGM